jgi:hypothetical protein
MKHRRREVSDIENPRARSVRGESENNTYVAAVVSSGITTTDRVVILSNERCDR